MGDDVLARPGGHRLPSRRAAVVPLALLSGLLPEGNPEASKPIGGTIEGLLGAGLLVLPAAANPKYLLMVIGAEVIIGSCGIRTSTSSFPDHREAV